MTDATGAWGYAYDGADRLTNRFSGEVQNRNLKWDYDAAGNRPIKDAAGSSAGTYMFGRLNRLGYIPMGWVCEVWHAWARDGRSWSYSDCRPAVFSICRDWGFDHAYRGVIARRTRNRSEFAPSLWRGVNGQAGGPSIITFEYYEGAFDGEGPAYSLVGTFQEDDGTSVSVYRVQNYFSFEYFVNLANQVSVFDVLPGTLKADSCKQVCRAFASLDVASVVQHTPWFLAYNGGEVDTDNVLFVSSQHAATSHFVVERGNSMDMISYF